MTEALDTSAARHLSRVAEQMSAVLTNLQQFSSIDDGPKRIRNRLIELEEKALMDILRAPETYYQLTRQMDDEGTALLNFLECSLQAECQMRDPRSPLSKGVWTANGDRYFSPNIVANCTSARATAPEKKGKLISKKNSNWDPNKSYQAPVIAGGTVLDFYSPMRKWDPDESDLDLLENKLSNSFSSKEKKRLMNRIDKALKGIQSTSEMVYQFVTRGIRTLVPQKDPSRPDNYRSVSCRAFIGRTILVNPHLDQVTVERIADSLIHESVHAFLYEQEQAGKWVLEEEQYPSVVSPWTGNQIRFDSFLHACFVWFSLTKFWHLPEAIKYFHGDELERLGTRAIAGFNIDTPLAILQRNSVRVRPHVIAEIENLCALI